MKVCRVGNDRVGIRIVCFGRSESLVTVGVFQSVTPRLADNDRIEFRYFGRPIYKRRTLHNPLMGYDSPVGKYGGAEHREDTLPNICEYCV